MGDLFASFNPQTVVVYEFSGNWLASLSILFLIPQGYWLINNQISGVFRIIVSALIRELTAVFGIFIRPGTLLFFIRMFMFIVANNFLGLTPYVFTASSHLSFTLSLALPLWLERIVFRLVKQFNHNIAHLVPLGTPAPLIPVIVIIETVSSIIRPGTLAVRLAANIVAGHLLLVLLGRQGPNLGGLVLVGLIVGLLALITLECAVACIQAYVFTILSSLYVSEHTSLEIRK
jgi:F-type H+-transporting ATPase subunit a